MEPRRVADTTSADDWLPLPLVRFLVPPLRLLSAAMWHVVQQGHVKHYGMLEEFVTFVTEAVPEMLSYRQRAQLTLGLRARLILELCRGEDPADLSTLKPHLDRIHAPTVDPMHSEAGDEEVDESEVNFLELVQTLLKDPTEREHFFQNIFPEEYGCKYDKALQRLMLDFLTRLEQLLPVADFTQIVSWLSSSPSNLDQCLQSIPLTKQLKTLLEYHRSLGQLTTATDALPSTVDDYILSSLSLPPLVRVVIASEQADPTDLSDVTPGSDYTYKQDPQYAVENTKEHRDVSDEEKKEDEGSEGGGIISSTSQPPMSPSPPLLDLSLKRTSTTTSNKCPPANSQWSSRNNSVTKKNLNQTLIGQGSAWKRKISDSLDIPLKRISESSEIRNSTNMNTEYPFIYPWGGYTDIQEPFYPATTDVSKIPWSDQETLNLIDIWGNDSIQQSLKDCVRNRHIFNLISKKMLERGYMRTAEQCHTRIKRLKMSFKQCYENNISGAERLECKFYDQLKRILVNGAPASIPAMSYDDDADATVGDQTSTEQVNQECDWEYLGHSDLEGKNAPWTDLESQALISIWGEDRVQRELKGIHNNGRIFDMVSKRMAVYGYMRTAEQCQSRVKRLKLSCRQFHEHNSTGKRDRAERMFYNQLERVLVSDLPSYVSAPEVSQDTDAEDKDEAVNEDSEFPVYSYQEIEAAVNSSDERKKVPWSDNETLILLELWGDEKMQQNLRRCPHNGHIYSEISEKLNAHGYSRTSEQCHTRIKRLKLSYRQCRDTMNLPEDKRVDFKFYDLLDEILKKHPPSRRAPAADTQRDSATDSEKDLCGTASYAAPDKSTPGSWSDAETLALIDIWAEDEIQKALKGVIHNGHVFADISEKLHDLGFSKTPEQCRWKVKTLRQNFRQCYERKKCGRDKVGYKFYEQLEQVLGYEALSIDVFDEKEEQETVVDNTKFAPWSEPETLALIEIWSQKEIQESLKGCIRNGHIYAEISEQMAAMGFAKTAEQCHKRVTKLRKTYRRCYNSMIHGGKPVLFRYFRFLEPVLGNLRSSHDADATDVCVDTVEMPESVQETQSQRAARKAVAESSRKMPWSDRETKALLEIWGEDRIQYNLKGCLKNKHIFKHISKRMTAQGFIRTAEQCQTRVKRLKARFFNEKEDCKFYEQLEKIFYKDISSDASFEDSVNMSGELESITDSEPDSPPPAPRQTCDGPKLPWTDCETQALIDIWGSGEVQGSLRGCTKNKHIFTQISQAMIDQGYIRTAEQCQSRVKRLKASFRQCSDSNRIGLERVECKFYDQLYKIFGFESSPHNPAPEESAATSTDGDATGDQENGNEDEACVLLETCGREDVPKHLK
ncbi:uncharacterized protein LOC114764537 isoform X2 [Denticeps clupeoides]|uniref:Myb-like domain-containing protein n=1 Tax=Denticeps clupeoides TaxID=299321 RepID=A0AAY4AUG2_9TELE|nr:uncharacterized protein LOC114764537 isoform X2 [Denticeps clupeoides]